MQYMSNEPSKNLFSGMESIVRNVAAGISAKVNRKYGSIDLTKVPDHVNYAKVEKYLRSLDIEIT